MWSETAVQKVHMYTRIHVYTTLYNMLQRVLTEPHNLVANVLCNKCRCYRKSPPPWLNTCCCLHIPPPPVLYCMQECGCSVGPQEGCESFESVPDPAAAQWGPGECWCRPFCTAGCNTTHTGQHCIGMYVRTYVYTVCTYTACVCVVMPQPFSHQHKPMKSRQRAISEYLANELQHMGCSWCIQNNVHTAEVHESTQYLYFVQLQLHMYLCTVQINGIIRFESYVYST